MNHELHGFGTALHRLLALDEDETLDTRLTRLASDCEVLRVVIDYYPGGLMVYDKDLRVVLCNRQQKLLLDYPPELFAFGPPTMEQVFRSNALRGEYGVGDPDQQVREHMARATRRVAQSFECRRPNGQTLEVDSVPLPDGGFLAVYRDVTAQRQAAWEERLAARPPVVARIDPPPQPVLDLTAFLSRMQQVITAVKVGQVAALHSIDLDRFQSVVERLGPQRAERLVVQVGQRIREIARSSDVVARLGDDEFLVLQSDVARPSDAARLASRVIDAMRQPFRIDNFTVTVSASSGVALLPRDGMEVEALIARARESLNRSRLETTEQIEVHE